MKISKSNFHYIIDVHHYYLRAVLFQCIFIYLFHNKWPLPGFIQMVGIPTSSDTLKESAVVRELWLRIALLLRQPNDRIFPSQAQIQQEKTRSSSASLPPFYIFSPLLTESGCAYDCFCSLSITINLF